MKDYKWAIKSRNGQYSFVRDKRIESIKANIEFLINMRFDENTTTSYIWEEWKWCRCSYGDRCVKVRLVEVES